MTDRLDAELADLGTAIAFPPSPDLRAAVASRLDQPGRRWGLPRAWPRALALAGVATLALAATVAALAFVLPGLRLTFVPSLPTPSLAEDGLAARLALGDRVALDDIEVRLPSALGPPDEAYLADGGGVVSLVWSSGDGLTEISDSEIGLLIQEIAGALDAERISKLVVEVGATVVPLEVDGADGFWIEGPPHLVRYLAPDGRDRVERTRLVGDSLVWERDGTLYRIESGLGRDATLRIAESIGE